ncbi:hypothetical protein [Arhodomonas aquaeolei]|uniref:hypothetical protein n=1 Tax=Arhodomonas aquaeolei TaxID=2369 RepID=UPI000372785B|nr:hypothetical protein [Arhodomonas aquaeolei]
MADNVQRLGFFARMTDGLDTLGLTLTVIVPRPALVREGRRRGIDVRLIGPRDDAATASEEALERRTDTLTPRQAGRLHAGTRQLLAQLHHERGIALLLVWNGRQVAGLAATGFAREADVPVLFLQAPWLAGRLMADPCGTHLASSIHAAPERLDAYPVSERAYLRWHGLYRTRRRESASVPAGSPTPPAGSPGRWLDRLYTRLGASAVPAPPARRRQLRQQRAVSAQLSALRDPMPGRYALYIAQPDDDPLVALDSPVNAATALANALERARARHLPLVVRLGHDFHDPRLLAGIIARLRQYRDVYLTASAIYPLVEYAERVITINDVATVLDARVLERPLDVLGGSLLAALDEDRLARLILGYTVPVDFFSHRPVPPEAIREMITRLPPGQRPALAGGSAAAAPEDAVMTLSPGMESRS